MSVDFLDGLIGGLASSAHFAARLDPAPGYLLRPHRSRLTLSRSRHRHAAASTNRRLHARRTAESAGEAEVRDALDRAV